MADLYVIATITGKPERADELRTVMAGAIAHFRKEDGCISYELLADRDVPGQFMTYEVWRDRAALDAHMISPAMAAAGPKLADLLTGKLAIAFLDHVPVG